MNAVYVAKAAFWLRDLANCHAKTTKNTVRKLCPDGYELPVCTPELGSTNGSWYRKNRSGGLGWSNTIFPTSSALIPAAYITSTTATNFQFFFKTNAAATTRTVVISTLPARLKTDKAVSQLLGIIAWIVCVTPRSISRVAPSNTKSVNPANPHAAFFIAK